MTRPDPDNATLARLFKRERDGKRVRPLHAIILLNQLGNAERVADLSLVDAYTIRRWVYAFNERGLEGLYGKRKLRPPSYPDPRRAAGVIWHLLPVQTLARIRRRQGLAPLRPQPVPARGRGTAFSSSIPRCATLTRM